MGLNQSSRMRDSGGNCDFHYVCFNFVWKTGINMDRGIAFTTSPPVDFAKIEKSWVLDSETDALSCFMSKS